MTSRSEKRCRVRPAVETLEGRALLTVAPFRLPAPEVANLGSIHESASKPAPVIVLLGKAKGAIYAITSGSTTGVNTLLVGNGLATGLPGLVVLTGVQETALHGSRVQVTKGSATFAPLAASTGSYLLVTYTGSGPVAKTGATQTFSISGTVNGGKGAYSAAKGTFSGNVVVDPKLGTMTMNYVMKVRPVVA